MSTASIIKLATATADTTRINSGKTAQETNLEDVKILPLLPVTAETIEMMGLNSPRESKETFTYSHEHTDGGQTVDQLPDIQEGDRMIVGGTNYKVDRVAEWNDGTYDFRHVVVQEVKGS